jgi:haloacetate dehalogenase
MTVSTVWAARASTSPLSADPLFPGFTAGSQPVGDDVAIAYVTGGSGPPVLLLHGYPQTRAMWAAVAPKLAERYTVIAADLRGYGASSKPAPDEDGAPYSFRTMASDMATLMSVLGHERFHFVGHDRGARVGHRFARDHGSRLRSLTLMDIIPTVAVWDHMDAELAGAYWHWLLLAQPTAFAAPLIEADPDRFFHHCLESWGAARLEEFPPAHLEAYRAAWRDPAMIHASCADYRAAALLDPADDAADAHKLIACPLLVLTGGGWRHGPQVRCSGAVEGSSRRTGHSPNHAGRAFLLRHPPAGNAGCAAWLS